MAKIAQASRTLTAAQTKNRFAESLRRAEAGEILEITRHGRPVAALVGIDQVRQLYRLRSAGPAAGLAGLVGKFDDCQDFAQSLDEVAAARAGSRELPELGE